MKSRFAPIFVQKKVILYVFLATITFIVFIACKKQFNTIAQENDLAVSNAKSYFSTILSSEKSLLDMPYNQLSKRSYLRRFSRLGKLSNLLEWNMASSYSINDVYFTIVPIKQDIKPFSNKSFESVRSMIFYKIGSHNMQMNIVEAYSFKNGTLGSNASSLIRYSFENLIFKRNDRINTSSASVVFYDRFYHVIDSYTISNGVFKKSKMRFTNQPKQVISSNPVNTVNSSSSAAPLSNPLNTKRTLNSCLGCQTMYLVGTWYDPTTLEVVDTEILDSWDECTDPNHVPVGSAPSVSSVSSSSNFITISNNLNNRCLSNAYKLMLKDITNIINKVQNDENLNYSFVVVFNEGYLGTGVNGGTNITSNGNVFTINITMNLQTLPNAALEYTARSFLHETLHALLLEQGSPAYNSSQHDEIAADYRSLIQQDLESEFPSLTDAYALSWAGLESSKSFQALDPTEQQDIISTNTGYLNRNSGTPC